MFGKMLLLNYQHFYEDEERRGSDKAGVNKMSYQRLEGNIKELLGSSVR